MELKQRRLVGEGVKFERIRRITGYLVGSVERFNDAKRAEVKDRVKHVKVSRFSQRPCETAFQGRRRTISGLMSISKSE